MMPLSPVHLGVTGDEGSGVILRWTRRSRLGWRWLDGADAPLGEEVEAYVVTILAGDLTVRSETVSDPFWTYFPDAIAADRVLAAGMPLTAAVRQRGTFGVGPAAHFDLSF